jgi:hypothetical protein
VITETPKGALCSKFGTTGKLIMNEIIGFKFKAVNVKVTNHMNVKVEVIPETSCVSSISDKEVSVGRNMYSCIN